MMTTTMTMIIMTVTTRSNARCYRPSQRLVMAFRLYPVSQASHFTAAGYVCAEILHDVQPVEHSVSNISEINKMTSCR